MITKPLFSCDDLDDRLQVLSWTEDSQEIEVVKEVLSTSASCPSCQNRFHRKHSRYTRRVADLPMKGKNVHLLILSNKLFRTTVTARLEWFLRAFGDVIY
ncbi:transposase family protein [Salibacterium aidingense]|uniref:transposase family protein n=1 Tax=Salibacterium aidingense TaxID=384933 RepID=UPI000A009940